MSIAHATSEEIATEPLPQADFWPPDNSWSAGGISKARNKVTRITESVAARYGALPATTPMLATVSPFFIEGTAQTYRTTPLDRARASHTVLPNRSDSVLYHSLLGLASLQQVWGSLVQNGDYLLMLLRNAPNGIPELWRVSRYQLENDTNNLQITVI